ncbi:MAG TPA: universal stress protein [Rugosimonospora sp.]|jgi:nucleotide-binding universal stress UspA family protein
MERGYRIVVGVDGSDGGCRALRWAVAEAGGRDGTVRAITAWHPDNLRRTLIIANDLADPRRYAEQVLAEAIAAARGEYPRVGVDGEVVRGDPAETLVGAASGADLLVLGSHGHGRLARTVLGSVAEAAIHAGVCPVVVVPVRTPPAAKER